MDLPFTLKANIENLVQNVKHTRLVEDAQKISLRYRTESGNGKRLLTTDSEAVAYCAARMPATFGVISSALGYMLDLIDFDIRSLLDVGSGTGAGAWAANEFCNLNSVVCLEREKAMREVGQKLMSSSSEVLEKAQWINFDITTEEAIKYRADLVLASYMLNELSNEDKLIALDKLWNATDKVLLIIEPGTPVGYNQLKNMREYLIGKGGQVIAPCTHQAACKLTEEDWCHFTCRIQRDKLHKQLKNADVPYEDEKYSYIAIAKQKFINTANARILRHPDIEKGKINLDVCTSDGIKKISIYKRDGEIFKKAKKAKCGDEILL